MQRLNRHDFPGATYSERVIQFGEGNFLRAFIDWQLDWLNQHQGTDAGVVVVRPRNRAVSDSLNQQDGLYTTLIRGLDEQGERVSETRLIRSLNRESSLTSSMKTFWRWRARRRCGSSSPTPPKRASPLSRAIA